MPPVIMGWSSTWCSREPELTGQQAPGAPDLQFGAQVELDRSRVGLVQQAADVGLEHDRSAQAGRDPDRLVGAGDRP